MAYWKRTGHVFATVIVLAAGLALGEVRDAEARGGRGRHPVFVGGFYSPYFRFGFGPWGAFGPWGGPWTSCVPGQCVDTLAVAKMTGWGALDLNVKPGRADVWVDAEYVGEARDLDGHPSYLWLEKGPHHLAIYKGGYETFEEDVDVERGVLKELKVRLAPGDSPPPGPRPSVKGQPEEKSRGEVKDDENEGVKDELAD
jgi:hypothetical protein